MILDRLLAHLKSTPAATLGELARVVGSEPGAVRSMLETLQRRGLVHRRPVPAGCGTQCRQCLQGDAEIYCLGPAPVAGEAAACGSGGRKTKAPGT